MGTRMVFRTRKPGAEHSIPSGERGLTEWDCLRAGGLALAVVVGRCSRVALDRGGVAVVLAVVLRGEHMGRQGQAHRASMWARPAVVVFSRNWTRRHACTSATVLFTAGRFSNPLQGQIWAPVSSERAWLAETSELRVLWPIGRAWL